MLQPSPAPVVTGNEMLQPSGTNGEIGIFPFGETSLDKAARLRLDSIIAVMQNVPGVQLVILGYADGLGTELKNRDISRKRVDACFQYLTAHGIGRERLTGKAMGACCPLEPETLAGKDNPAGRQKNRRVTFNLILPPQNE